MELQSKKFLASAGASTALEVRTSLPRLPGPPGAMPSAFGTIRFAFGIETIAIRIVPSAHPFEPDAFGIVPGTAEFGGHACPPVADAARGFPIPIGTQADASSVALKGLGWVPKAFCVVPRA